MMDIEEWEVLPDDGFLEIHDDGSGNKIFSRKYETQHDNVFQMSNYFNVSPRSSQRFHLDDEIIKLPIELDLVVPPQPPPPPPAVITASDEMLSNQDGVSQVFFKKENEFVDMKMDSPRSNASSIGTVPPFGTFKYEDDDMASSDDEKENLVTKNNYNRVDSKISGTEKEEEEENGGVGRFNLWRWSLNGVGAICSFGVAAATICIIVFTTHQKNKNQHNRKLRFQIYTDDKRIKQVVQHATKLNEAISVARGVPLTRANFTVGGYYDGL